MARRRGHPEREQARVVTGEIALDRGEVEEVPVHDLAQRALPDHPGGPEQDDLHGTH
jgi:hypothetical protein